MRLTPEVPWITAPPLFTRGLNSASRVRDDFEDAALRRDGDAYALLVHNFVSMRRAASMTADSQTARIAPVREATNAGTFIEANLDDSLGTLHRRSAMTLTAESPPGAAP